MSADTGGGHHSLERHWEEVAAAWGASGGDQLWRVHSDMVNTELLRRWLRARPGQLILKTDLFDEAVAAGILPCLLERNLNVTAVDVSSNMVRLAADRYPALTAHRADVRDLPFQDNTFDAIVSLSTLDHFRTMDDIRQSLRELHRVLRPGGELIVTLDNTANPLVWLRNTLPFGWLRRSGLVPYFIGCSCGPRRLATMVEDTGFEIRDASAILHVPRVMAVAVSRLVARASVRIRQMFLGFLLRFEVLESLPTRSLTGHFTAIRAGKKVDAPDR